MKKIIALLLLGMGIVGTTLAAEPDEYNTCIEYLYTNCNAKAGDNFGLELTGKGLVICRWELPVARPVLEDVLSVKDQALAWKAGLAAKEAADRPVAAATVESQIRALVVTINLRLPADKQITEEEILAVLNDHAR